MKIVTLLPYKEDYTPRYSGAVSIHVSSLIKFSKFEKSMYVYGNTSNRKFLSDNYNNVKIKKSLLKSNNKAYLEKFIKLNSNNQPDIIEIHNRPSYIALLKKKLNSKVIIYFHNNPLLLSGSKTKTERLFLLENCDYIFFNSNWTKNKFFENISETQYISKFGICYQSTKKSLVNIKKKEKIISFVGKLNSAKGYDIFGQSIIRILNEFPDWKCIVVGDEPREKHIFKNKNLKIFNFKENNFVLNLLKKTSIFVACSRWEEPFGRSSLEACSMGCATIITNRGGLIETTKHPIIIDNLDTDTLYESIKTLIVNPKIRKKAQELNYKSFYLTHEYVSNIIDNVREKILSNNYIKRVNIDKKSKLKIIHVTNFNHRYFGRLQYNTGVRFNNGLIKNGHNVISLSDRDLISYTKSLRDPTGEKYLNKLLANTIENFKPDLLLLGHADRINSETLNYAKIKYPYLKISQWFLDPLSKNGPDYDKNKLRVFSKSKECDTTFITTSPDALDFKIKNSFFLPNPCDKSLDNLQNFRNDKDYDVFYAISHGVHRGNLRLGKKDEREQFIDKLLKKCDGIKFDLYGMFGRQPVWGNEFLNKLSNSKMALNLSRGKPIKYYSSDRIAQLMGNGLLTFIHNDTKFNDFFSDKEMIFYKNISDLSEKIKKFKRDKKKASEIAKRGHEIYHKHFNSSVVSNYIINKTFGINSKYYWE